jgi:hypothetical protein
MTVSVAGPTSTRDGGYLTIRTDFANAIVVGVGDVNITAVIDSDSDWTVKLRSICRAVEISCYPSPGNSGDNACRRNLADTIIAGVCDVKVAFRVDGQSGGCIEGVVATCKCYKSAFSRKLANRIAFTGIGNIDCPVAADCDTEWIGEARGRAIAC